MPDSPLKILIVDDSIVFRKAIEAALSELDGVLITGSVRNGEKAMASIVANPPDLVTLDLEMPDMDGLACLKAIQEFNAGRPELPPVRCLMISGYTKAGADVTIEALANGAFDFIEKPESRTPAESVAKLKESLFAKLKALHAPAKNAPASPPRLRKSKRPRPKRRESRSLRLHATITRQRLR
jgi:two-component system chemotaxis response regulator CheB